jgi:putative acetyltransferase
MQLPPPYRLRPVEDADSAAILAILERVFSEYPNCFLELSEVPELIAPATSFAEMGGAFWVAEDDAGVAGFIALTPDDEEPGTVELKKLYTDRRARGVGLGGALVRVVEEEASRRGAARIHLWSDTRFETAHGVYEHLGYARLAETRELHDVSDTVEYHYEKRLPRR